MNAESYLRKQGWKGSGHSLDSTGRGIKKPLLIAHKQDQLGLGKKKAAWTTDDQWWMRAFDESLKTIGTGQEVWEMVRLPEDAVTHLATEHSQPDPNQGRQPRRPLRLLCQGPVHRWDNRRQLSICDRRLHPSIRRKHPTDLGFRQ
jgi:hypothetical protein